MLKLKKNHFALTIMMCLIASTSFGQEKADEQSISKKEQRKQEKKEVYAANLKAIRTMVADSSFVVEAYNLRGRKTVNYFVSPATNFVKVDGENVVIQTANTFGVGYNGLGGITITGNVKKYDVKESDHGVNLMIQFSSPVIGFSTLNISANASGKANAYLSTAFGGYADFSGDIVGLTETSTYEGQSVLY